MSRRNEPSKIVKEINENIDLILNGQDHKKFIYLAEKFGEDLKYKRVKTSQIRKIYTEVQKIRSFEDSDQMRLNMLRPKLAYAKGRHRNLTDLQNIFDKMIERIDTVEQLNNFKNFFEAILAYHKAFGGGE